jgi:hypothetical protein
MELLSDNFVRKPNPLGVFNPAVFLTAGLGKIQDSATDVVLHNHLPALRLSLA